jgi:hypothetical protein
LVEALARAVIGKAPAVGLAAEREDDLQLPAELERDFGSDLVGAVGDRRYEAQVRLFVRKAGALALVQRMAGVGDEQQDVADALAELRKAAVGEDLGAVPSDSDAEDERDARRGRDRCSRSLDVEVRGGDRAAPSRRAAVSVAPDGVVRDEVARAVG